MWHSISLSITETVLQRASKPCDAESFGLTRPRNAMVQVPVYLCHLIGASLFNEVFLLCG